MFCVAQLQQYKVVSQSFEKRVLDLQKEMKKKDDEIAELKKEDSSLKLELSRIKHKGESFTFNLEAWGLVSEHEHREISWMAL